jgi:hypothetical protein
MGAVTIWRGWCHIKEKRETFSLPFHGTFPSQVSPTTRRQFVFQGTG